MDDDISFSSSAFDVVGSWLLGGKAAASNERVVQESTRVSAVQRAPVTLYRPSSKTASVTGSGGAETNGKILTEQEKEMKKKLLRKSGTYRHKQQEEESEAVDTEKLDKEDEALLRARHGERTDTSRPSTTTEANGAVAPIVLDASTVVAASASSSASSSAVVTSNKKRKVSAQDELLEKLREEAARKKAKNLKVKQRLQRKKEEAKTQQQVQQAAT